jgi:hypothetical protein
MINKKSVWILISLGIIFLIMIVISKKNPVENQLNENISYQKDQFSNITELHWTHMPLSYKIINCTDYQKNRIVKAFNQIQKETENVVSFENVQINEDITVYCNKEERPTGYYDYYTSGESYYQVYENYSNRIAHAEINFYGITETTYSSGCTIYPDIEIHEILHAFGFEHTNQSNHIMNPYHTYCPSKLNQDIIDRLITIYGS